MSEFGGMTPEAIAVIQKARLAESQDRQKDTLARINKSRARQHARRCKRAQDPTFLHQRDMKRFKERKRITADIPHHSAWNDELAAWQTGEPRGDTHNLDPIFADQPLEGQI